MKLFRIFKRLSNAKRLTLSLVITIAIGIILSYPNELKNIFNSTLEKTQTQERLSGKVIKIADGDTLTLLANDKQAYRIRLYGIDAPESKQAYGKKAKEFLASLVGNKEVVAIIHSQDKYQRYLATILLQDTDINAKMVENGYAWAYSYYTNKYKKLETQAKENKLGLWNDKNPINPKDFRDTHKKG